MVKAAVGPASKGVFRHVLLLSANASPVPPGADTGALLSRADQLREVGFRITLVPLDPSADTELFRPLVDADSLEAGRSAASWADLQALAGIKSRASRRLRCLRLTLGDGPSVAPITVGLYSLIGVPKPPAKVKLRAADASLLVPSVTWLNEHGGLEANPMTSGAPKCVDGYELPPPQGSERGPQAVVFSAAELKQLRQMGGGGASLRVLGFRSAAALSAHHHLRTPQFIYPEEARGGGAAGSAAAFWALHAAMLQRGAGAVAVLTSSEGSEPKLVALLPQAGRSAGGPQPDGMHVVFLPFADDIRSPETSALVLGARPAGQAPPVASDEAVAAAARLAAAWQLEGRDQGAAMDLLGADAFRDPAAALFRKVLTELALLKEDDGVRLPPPPREAALALLQEVEALPEVRDAAAALKQELQGDDYAEREAAASKPKSGKRAAGGDEAGEAKKPKKEIRTEAQLRELHEAQQLEKATIDDLKGFCREHNLPLSGKKGDLLERVVAHM